MDLSWEQQHRLNVILLTAVGLWPHSNTLVLRLQRIFMSTVTVTVFVCNLATFTTMDYNTRLLLTNAPTIFLEITLFLKYVSYRVASDCIKRVTESINRDWKDLSSKEEFEIIEKYVERGQFYTRSFAMFFSPGVLCVLLGPFSSMFLDIVMPLNESRNHNFPFMFEPIFLDQQKDFFLVVFLFDTVTILVGLVFVATESLLIVYIQHACALFEVTRVKKLLSAAVGKHSKRRSHLVLMAEVVQIHSRAIRYCETIKEEFLRSYLLLVIFGVLCLSTYLFRCTQTFAARELGEFVTSSLLVFAILGYAFYINFVLQDVIDSSIDIFDDLYNTEWYEFSTSTQKFVLFCMLKTLKPVDMDLYGLFHPSYAGFTTILRMSLSYVTALNSFK